MGCRVRLQAGNGRASPIIWNKRCKSKPVSEGDHAWLPPAVTAHDPHMCGLHAGKGAQDLTYGPGPSCRHDPAHHWHPSRKPPSAGSKTAPLKATCRWLSFMSTDSRPSLPLDIHTASSMTTLLVTDQVLCRMLMAVHHVPTSRPDH